MGKIGVRPAKSSLHGSGSPVPTMPACHSRARHHFYFLGRSTSCQTHWHGACCPILGVEFGATLSTNCAYTRLRPP